MVTFGVQIAEERNDTIGVRQSRWTRLVTGLLKAWPPNPVCQFGAGRINYHTNALPFQSQIVIVVSIKDSVASFSLTESLPSEEFTPKIKQIVSNVLVVRLEKEKMNFVQWDTSPKAWIPRRTPGGAKSLGNQLGSKKAHTKFLLWHICLQSRVY